MAMVSPSSKNSSSTAHKRPIHRNDTNKANNNATTKNTRKFGQQKRHNSNNQHKNASNHRFGQVMHHPPKLKLHPTHSNDDCLNSTSTKIYPTVSIAVPGSILCNAQTVELQTHLAGQIARAAAIYRVDEIVVYDDGLAGALSTSSGSYSMGGYFRRGSKRMPLNDGNNKDKGSDSLDKQDTAEEPSFEKQQSPSTNPHAFLARILQYCECPQYLRRKFFPMHPDLQFAGLLPPLDAPHHLRRWDVLRYREGVVIEEKNNIEYEDEKKEECDTKKRKKREEETGSLVDCGVPNRLVQVDHIIPIGMRCTIQLDLQSYNSHHPPSHKKSNIEKSYIQGTVVSPTTPRDVDGIYWGYTTRLASSLHAIFEECPYEGGYDLKIGTSERGDVSIDDPNFCLQRKVNRIHQHLKRKKLDRTSDNMNKHCDDGFRHLLIVFGGVAGIEESVDADESIKISGEESKMMFDVWVNICPYQGSRTIRTEEAILITLSRLSPLIVKNATSPSEASMKPQVEKGSDSNLKVMDDTMTEDVIFSDAAISEESSEEE